MRDIADRDVQGAVEELGLSDELRGAVLAALRSARSAQAPSIAAAGAQNLLDQPEFQDLRKLRSILRIVEEQKTLYDMVADSIGTDTASVKIGAESRSSPCRIASAQMRSGCSRSSVRGECLTPVWWPSPRELPIPFPNAFPI